MHFMKYIIKISELCNHDIKSFILSDLIQIFQKFKLRIQMNPFDR